jgi:nickel/cobalt tolerance cation efflux system protein
VVACVILPSLGRVFLPEFREKSLVNSMVLYPGVSLEMTNRAGLALSKTLKASPLFEWVQVRTGRAPGDACPASTPLADSRQPSWPVRAPRLSLATTWGRRHEN